MAATLTLHDRSILGKIKDPEAGPSSILIVDSSLPRDPHLNPEAYQKASELERGIILNIQRTELQFVDSESVVETRSILRHYFETVKSLDQLIDEFPNYASARNNRAQALRRIYGDRQLIGKRLKAGGTTFPNLGLQLDASDDVLLSVVHTILTDLSTAINLLKPAHSFVLISPQSAKTLSQAYTQRGAMYHMTAKVIALEGAVVRFDDRFQEAKWSDTEFEECASRDFALGGQYGNEVAKALTVATNPTAKLCGEMVKEAMRTEFCVGSSA